MANTHSAAVSRFIAALPAERQPEFTSVRQAIVDSLPSGYEEVVSKQMLVYQVPLERYADTYNGHPLWYVALASEKSYLSLHLMPIYGDPAMAQRLADGFKAAGKKLNMGKACVRFTHAEDLALDVVGDIVGRLTPERWIQIALAARRLPTTSAGTRPKRSR